MTMRLITSGLFFKKLGVYNVTTKYPTWFLRFQCFLENELLVLIINIGVIFHW